MSLYLRQIPVGPMKNFAYLIGDDAAKRCWIVDPAWDVETVLAAAAKDGYAVDGALVTHAHYDHCNALDQLLKARDMPVYVQKREVEISQKAVQTGLFGFLPAENLKIVAGGDTISLGATTLTFLHTPGHTPGSQCFLVDGRLVSGDTLFIGTCGRCDLPGGNPYEMYETLSATLGKLPGNTVLLPGHDYSAAGKTSTLEKERTGNKMLRARSIDDFLALVGL